MTYNVLSGTLNLAQSVNPRFGLYLWENWSDLCETFATNVTLDNQVIQIRIQICLGRGLRSPSTVV